MAFNTGNPVPSTDFRDLSDNSENMDKGMNALTNSFNDRLGVARKTWAGMEADFLAAQADRNVVFEAGEATRAALTANLANSSDPAKGAALVGYSGTTVKAFLDTFGSTSSPSFTALTLTNGQLFFPASQVPSANANCLDDYEEGTWTPTLTFATAGNLAVVYSSRLATYTKVGRLVTVNFEIVTTTFTWTTATGAFLITGLPFVSPAAASSPPTVGALAHSGPTFPANYVTMSPYAVPATSQVGFYQSSGLAGLNPVTQANAPTATNYVLRGSLTYWVP